MSTEVVNSYKSLVYVPGSGRLLIYFFHTVMTHIHTNFNKIKIKNIYTCFVIDYRVPVTKLKIKKVVPHSTSSNYLFTFPQDPNG